MTDGAAEAASRDAPNANEATPTTGAMRRYGFGDDDMMTLLGREHAGPANRCIAAL